MRWQVSSQNYHADTTRFSRSMLEDFRRWRPLFYQRYLAPECERLPKRESEALAFGSAVHERVFDYPEDFWEKRGAIAPKVDRRTKEGKALWAEFQAASSGRLVLSSEDAAVIEGIYESVMRNPMIRDRIVLPHEREAAFAWEWPGCSLPLKTMFDWIHLGFDAHGSRGLILDLKTAESIDPGRFSGSIVRYGYHRQVAFYRRCAEVELGLSPETMRFLFIAVEKEPPYACVVYELDDAAVVRGEREVEVALWDLERCLESGDFSDPLENCITVLHPF